MMSSGAEVFRTFLDVLYCVFETTLVPAVSLIVLLDLRSLVADNINYVSWVLHPSMACLIW